MKKLTGLLLVGLLFAGCESTTTTTSNGDLMPLTVGNSWTYHEWRADSTFVLRSEADFTISLLSSAVVKGITRFRANFGAEYFYLNGGLWSATQTASFESFMAKYPVSSGEQLPTDSVVITEESSPDPIDLAIGTEQLTGENVRYVASDGKSYNTVQFRRTYRGTVHDSVYMVEIQYYQLGTGLVLHEHQRPDASGALRTSDRWELASSTVK